jgi:hypothetical protein
MQLTHAVDSLRTSYELGSNISRDEAVNDLEHYRSNINASAVYGINTRPVRLLLHSLELGASGSFDRTKQLNASSDLRGTTDTFELTASGVRRLWLGFRATTSGRAGYAEIESENQQRSTATRNRTEQAGPSLNASATVSNHAGKRSPPVQVDVTVTNDSFRQATEDITVRYADSDFDEIEEMTRTDRDQTNLARSLKGNLAAEVTEWLTTDVRLSRTLRDEVRPNPQAGRAERTDLSRDDASLGFGLTPIEALSFSGQYAVSDESSRSEIQDASNKDQSSTSVDLTARVVQWGFETDLTFSTNRTESDYVPRTGQVTSSLQDLTTELNQIEATVKRALSKTIAITAKSNLSLRQAFYQIPDDDPLGFSTLDRDSRDWINDLTLDYDPTKALATQLSVKASRKRLVNVHPERSGNTNTETELAVSADYTYTGRTGYRFGQKVSMSARSRAFDFTDADQSDLNRNTRLETRVGATILPKTTLNLDHVYNFRNVGKYNDDDDDGIRLFTLERESVEQELQAGVKYTPYAWINFGGKQTLRVVETRIPGRDPDRSTRYDLELVGSFNRRLMEEVDASLSVTRSLSTQEDFYWKITATASRTF